MYIKKINIKNFRQIKDVEINFSKLINLIAGSNNSGKTTLLELFNIIFNCENFKVDDFNNKSRAQIEENFENYKKNELDIKCLSDIISGNKIEIDITIEYNEKDNISLIGEYINELRFEDKQIYFKVECMINTNEIGEVERIVQVPLLTKYFYTDSNFEYKEEIDKKDFKEKFNCKIVNARRDVNDTNSDTSNLLSKNLHKIVQNDDNWNTIISQIKTNIENVGNDDSANSLEKVFEDLKSTLLETLIKDYENTNGGNIIDLRARLELNSSDILKMLSKSVLLKYDFDGVMLSEGSQGLGYSNLLYILMKIYKYDETFDEKKVNILLIEEPESHMHPTMERRIIKYLKNDKNLKQLIITSHSKEMIEFVDLESIKVLRKENNETMIYDLNKYCASEVEDSKFIKKFVRLISDIFYADKVIMFEGDGERLYLDHVVNTNSKYSKLREKYVSYIQVGGRHAINYKSILKFLNIKVLILSDIDYHPGKQRELKSLSSIENEKTTNPTIRSMMCEEVTKISEKILQNNYGASEKIAIFTQTKKDGYARSFEDALLFNMYSSKLKIKTVLEEISKEEWENFNDKNKIFEIANTNSDSTHLLSRSMSIKVSKTEFIYDYIKAGCTEIPDYIERGLAWLMNE